LEKTDRVCRNGNQHRLTLPFITKGRLCGFFLRDFFYVDVHNRPTAGGK
ncbi:hypothetical protein HMPREF9144_2859, partial [Prevotella pallens ATCC 700821]